MSIDPVNIAALNSQSKSGPTSPAAKEQNPQPQPAPQPAQTGAASPPVIASFSAAALLTARAVGAAGQTADQDPVRKRDEKKREEEQGHTPDPESGSRVNRRV